MIKGIWNTKLYLVIFGLLLFIPPALSAEEDPLIAQVIVPFDQLVKQTSWTPLQLLIENRGPDWRGEAVIKFRLQRFVTSLDLPAGTKKKYEWIIPPQSIQGNPVIQLVQGKRLYNEIKGSVKPLWHQDMLILGLSQDRAGLGSLQGLPAPNTSGKINVVYPEPQHLPEHWLGYDAVNLVVLSRFSASELSSAQRHALTSYVQQGGLLLIFCDPDIGKFKDPWYRELLPATIKETTEIQEYHALTRRLTAPPFSRQPRTIIPKFLPRPTANILATGPHHLPLLMELPFGSGRIVACALDLQTEPLQNSETLKLLVQEVLGRKNYSNPTSSQTWGHSWPYPHLSMVQNYFLQDIRLKNAKAFSGRLRRIIGASTIYILTVGPLLYLFLRRRNRKEYFWVASAASVLLWTLAAYSFSFAKWSAGATFREFSILNLYAGSSTGRLSGYLGILADRRIDPSLKLNHPHLVITELTEPYIARFRGVQEDIYLEPSSATIPAIRLQPGESMMFDFQCPLQLEGTISSTLTVDRSAIRGSIINGLPFDIRDSLLIIGPSAFHVGDLPHGAHATHAVHLTLKKPLSPHVPRSLSRTEFPLLSKILPVEEEDRSNSNMFGYYQSGDLNAYWSNLIFSNAAMWSSQALLIGRVDHPLSSIQLDAHEIRPARLRAQRETLIKIAIPIQWKSADIVLRGVNQHFSVLSGQEFLQGRRYGSSAAKNGTVIYGFAPPPGLRVTSLKILQHRKNRFVSKHASQAAPSPSTPTVWSFWHVGRQAWVPLTMMTIPGEWVQYSKASGSSGATIRFKTDVSQQTGVPYINIDVSGTMNTP